MARSREGRHTWRESYNDAKERLRTPLWWYPFPMLLSFALVLLLTGHALIGTNPRMGNPASIVTFAAESRRDSPIWLSVTPIGDEIVVTTGDRKVFRWPQDKADGKALEPLRAYLKRAAAREVESAALVKAAAAHQTTAVIAADQRLKYLHVRPLLYAFAEAGIARYAFETLNPQLAQDTHESVTPVSHDPH